MAGASHAQYGAGRSPSPAYRGTFGAMYDGEYLRALKSFQSEGRGAVKMGTSLWIDSICYHAMAGECYYEMGRLPEALEHYTAAVNLYLAYPQWLTQVQYPAAGLQPARQMNLRTRPTWGASTRATQPAQFQDMMPIGVGRLDAGRAFQEGGVVANPMLVNIGVVEIVRCTTLAIRRRAELLGPACRYDAVTEQLLSTLSAKPGLPNHWSECWIDVQLGLAQLAAGKQDQGVKSLERGLTAAGRFDHPMTAVALVELGRAAMARGDLKAAENYFTEATYSAAFFEDIRLLEEAFRYGAMVHQITQPQTVYPPLAEALLWAKRNGFRELSCSLLVSLAESHAALGQTPAAAAELAEAGKWLARRDMAAGRLGARHAFVGSRVFFQQGNVAAGDTDVAKAMDYLSHGSHWLFHVTLADRLCVDGTITPRVAIDLYAEVLRDPEPEDWLFRPDESLATLVTPHFEPLEHWFEMAMDRKDHERALEITDRVRRHRFFTTLPFGGRLESLRWILEGPEEVLPERARQQRRGLLAAFPAYEKLSKDAVALRTRLHQADPAPEDPKQGVALQQGLAELGKLSAAQEILLRQIAVSRQAADLVFPPLRATADVQKGLPDGTAMLVFFATRRGTVAFLMNNARYDYWVLGSQVAIKRKIATLLRALGQFDANREVALDDLNKKGWQRPAQELLDSILANSQADFKTDFKQLIVVPDGLLWYVPFEALTVAVDGEPETLISRFQIRYAPTVGLAVPDGRRRKNVVRTGVALGRLFPRDEDAVAREAFDELAKVTPGAVALPPSPPAGSALYRVLFDELVVYDDIAVGKDGPYAWQPIPANRSKVGNSLADWLVLPWGGPQTIVLPGFHTIAETGLKRAGDVPGGEMFLSVCGLMAGGTRTVLLSRWRTGGPSSFGLIREFVQELPHAPPAEAWQRAVLVARDSRIDLEKEPRIKKESERATKPVQNAPKAEHPFFWAGYMLIDSGG